MMMSSEPDSPDEEFKLNHYFLTDLYSFFVKNWGKFMTHGYDSGIDLMRENMFFRKYPQGVYIYTEISTLLRHEYGLIFLKNKNNELIRIDFKLGNFKFFENGVEVLRIDFEATDFRETKFEIIGIYPNLDFGTEEEIKSRAESILRKAISIYKAPDNFC